jgi:hypothetical protein
MTQAIARAAEAPAPAVAGYLDAMADGRVFGWAWMPDRPEARLRARIEVEGQPPIDVPADRARPDLAANGVGDGAYAFEATVGEGVPSEAVRVVAYDPDSGASLELKRPAPALVHTMPGEADEIRDALRILWRANREVGERLDALGATVASAAAPVERALAELGDVGARLDAIDAAIFRIDGLLRARTDAERPAVKVAGPDRLALQIACGALAMGLLAFVAALVT